MLDHGPLANAAVLLQKLSMAATIITPDDLLSFKETLLSDIRKILEEKKPTRRWLKSNDVRRLLLVSPGTLQHLQANGTLPFSKVGGIIFYDYEDIQKMIERHKRNRPFKN